MKNIAYETRSSLIDIDEEEYELNTLNNRFANYLEKIKDLGAIHLDLRRQIDDIRSTQNNNSTNEQKFFQFRRQLNLESSKLNLFQVRFQHAEHEKKFYKNQIHNLTNLNETFALQQQLNAYVDELNVLAQHYANQQQDLQFYREQYNDYLTKLTDCSQQLDAMIADRLQTESDLCTLREQIGFEQKYNSAIEQEFECLNEIQTDFNNQYSKTELKNVIEKIREDYRKYNEIQLSEYEYFYKSKLEIVRQQIQETKIDETQEFIQDFIEQNLLLEKQIKQYENELQQMYDEKDLFDRLTTQINDYELSINNSRLNTVHLTSQINTYRCLLTNLTQSSKSPSPVQIHVTNGLIWARI